MISTYIIGSMNVNYFFKNIEVIDGC